MSVTTEDMALVPPEELPTDAASFWGDVPTDLVIISADPSTEIPVIDQLGAAPFKKEKGGFPFLGFLASVYEHVSTTAKAELSLPDPVPASSPAEAVDTADAVILSEIDEPPVEAGIQIFTTDSAHHTDPIEERP